MGPIWLLCGPLFSFGGGGGGPLGPLGSYGSFGGALEFFVVLCFLWGSFVVLCGPLWSFGILWGPLRCLVGPQ